MTTEDFTKLIAELRKATVNLYLLKKVTRKSFEAFRLPNGINDDIREKYCSNLELFVDGRSFAAFDFVHTTKNALIEIGTEKIIMWVAMQESIRKSDEEGVLLGKETFDDDYSIIVIDFAYTENDDIKHIYFVSKYLKTETWYKKGMKFAFTADGLVEKKGDILVLNGCIDAVILDDISIVLNENNFESMFNYYESAKKMVEDAKPEIEKWPILTSVDVFFAKATAGKTRTLRLANALKNSKTDWSKIPNNKVKEVLNGDERFSTITFDEKDKIICTEANADLIIDIIREVYSKQLFTEEIIETKGV